MAKPLNKCSILFVLALMLLAVFGCNGSMIAPTPSLDTPAPDDAGQVLADTQVRRELPIVWMGPGDVGPLPRLRDSDWHELAAGGQVTTDQNGEAWLDIDECLRIYLFHDSQLLKAACPKSSYTGGNVTCALSGTGVYNNSCSSQVVLQTLNADVVLEGTWVMLTYLPELELTVIGVAEGEVDVWPVTDFENREATDRPITVRSQELLFTSSDDRLDEIAQLPPRVPLPLVDIYPLMEELGLEEGLGSTREQAPVDHVPFPEPGEFEQEQAFVVRGAGGPLEESNVAEAIAHAVDWGSILEELFPDTAPYVTLQFREGDVRTDQIEFDSDFALDLLEDADFTDGFEIAVLVAEEEEGLHGVSEQIKQYLGEVDVQSTLITIPGEDAMTLLESGQAYGVPVLWVGTEFDGVDPVGVVPVPTSPPTATRTPTRIPTRTPTRTLTPTRTPTPGPLCTVVSQGLNLRTGPGTVFASPLTTLPRGTKLTPLYRDRNATWIYVRVQGRTQQGWVSAGTQFVNCNRDIRQLSPTVEPPTPTPTRTPSPTPTPTPTKWVSPTPSNIISLPGIHPNGLALDQQRGRLFVAGRDSNAVHVIDEKTLQEIAKIPVGRQPFNLHHDGEYIFVTNYSSDSISVIDPDSLEVFTEMGLGGFGEEPTFISGKDGLVYVVLHKMDGASGLVSIDCRGNVTQPPQQACSIVEEPVVTGYGAYGLAVAQNVNAAYVSNRDSFDVTSLSTKPELRTLPQYSARNLQGSPYVLAFSNFLDDAVDYFYLYLTHSAQGGPANRPNRLTVFSPMPELYDLRTVDIGDTGSNGGYIGIYPRVGSRWDHTVWVSADKQVRVFEPDLSRKITAFGSQTGIGSNPYAIVFNPANRRVYVSDGVGDFVTVLQVH